MWKKYTYELHSEPVTSSGHYTNSECRRPLIAISVLIPGITKMELSRAIAITNWNRKKNQN